MLTTTLGSPPISVCAGPLINWCHKINGATFFKTVLKILAVPLVAFATAPPRLSYPSKHDAFTQCCINVGPASKTDVQHRNSIVCGNVTLDLAGKSALSYNTMLAQCCTSVVAGGPTLHLHWVIVPWLVWAYTCTFQILYSLRLYSLAI